MQQEGNLIEKSEGAKYKGKLSKLSKIYKWLWSGERKSF